jgi:hypothetical protein
VGADLALSGNYSLIFTFGPNAPGIDSFAEQRFDMGRYLAEVWVEYQLYVPANFVHRDDSPSNNKFFTLWRDVYSDPAGTWQILYEFNRLTNTGPDDFSKLRFSARRWDNKSITDQGMEGVPGQYTPLFGGAGVFRLGEWSRVRFHTKVASSNTATDGVAKMWVNDRLILNVTNGKFYNYGGTATDALMRIGYFMGWSNSGYTEQTVFGIDDVKFYDNNPGW